MILNTYSVQRACLFVLLLLDADETRGDSQIRCQLAVSLITVTSISLQMCVCYFYSDGVMYMKLYSMLLIMESFCSCLLT